MSFSASTVGGVDSSIPLQAGRIGQTANPLAATPTSMLPLLEGINRLKMFPGEQQLQQQQIQSGQQTIQSNAITLQKQNNSAVYGHYLTLPADLHLEDVTRALGLAKANGFNVDAQVADAANTFKDDAPAAERLAWRNARIAQSGMTPTEVLAATTPQRGEPTRTGQQIIPTTTAPALSTAPGATLGPGGAPLGTVTEVPSASDLATPVHYTGADGKEVNTTKGEYAAARGVPAASLGPLVAGQSVPAPAAAPGAVAPSQAPPAGGGGPAVAPPPGGLTSTAGPPPGQVQAQTKGAEDSASEFTRINQQGVAARNMDALLGTMQIDARQAAPGGPLADLRQRLLSTIQSFGIPGNFGIDPTKIGEQEAVDKIGNQLADAMGAGSDARMRVNQGANPSMHNTPAGLDIILRQLRGNTDYLQARQQLAAAYPLDQNRKFEAEVGNKLDPRVFQAARLGGANGQRAAFFDNMPSEDKRAIMQRYKWAQQQGLINAAD